MLCCCERDEQTSSRIMSDYNIDLGEWGVSSVPALMAKIVGDQRSRWRRLRNGLPQGSVLAPLLFNIYTNDQPSTDGTRCFIYADDLGISAQHADFEVVEERLTKALEELTPYYKQITFVPIHRRHRCAPSIYATEKQRGNYRSPGQEHPLRTVTTQCTLESPWIAPSPSKTMWRRDKE